MRGAQWCGGRGRGSWRDSAGRCSGAGRQRQCCAGSRKNTSKNVRAARTASGSAADLAAALADRAQFSTGGLLAYVFVVDVSNSMDEGTDGNGLNATEQAEAQKMLERVRKEGGRLGVITLSLACTG